MNGQDTSSLASQTENFYSEICATVYLSVDCDIEDSVFDLLPKVGLSSITVVARVKVDGSPTIRLEASYVLNQGSERLLRVVDSEFHVKLLNESAPLFHYDFVGEARSELPAAHLNIHVSDEPLRALMATAGNRNRAKRRRKREVRGHNSQPAELHFPIGGRRFRPCLEDVVQFLIFELGVDRQLGWWDRVREGRATWKASQTAAAVKDDPKSALLELLRIGVLDEEDYEKAVQRAPEKRADSIEAY
ncbi:hypothetical protein A2T55_04240 [Brevibacterium linens]|uniref:Uncharacterized protein n=1 Tax=Brevibacterium linens TaxID=1703 RepID=A0A142NKK1_BRELN|nr:hypothetical protein [Brevibacterium linens]AMT93092.1 hypothetical protein A2T55_04240 [Brevibacterium linens]